MRRTACFAALLLAACSYPPQTVPPPATDVVLPGQAPVVWAATLRALTTAGMAIETIERDSWFVRAGGMVVPPGLRADSLFDCGVNAMNESRAWAAPIHVGASIMLQARGDSTALRLTVTSSVGEESDRGSRYPCVSLNRVEPTIINRIREALRAGIP